jgi:hypothetical protein
VYAGLHSGAPATARLFIHANSCFSNESTNHIAIRHIKMNPPSRLGQQNQTWLDSLLWLPAQRTQFATSSADSRTSPGTNPVQQISIDFNALFAHHLYTVFCDRLCTPI